MWRGIRHSFTVCRSLTEIRPESLVAIRKAVLSNALRRFDRSSNDPKLELSYH